MTGCLSSTPVNFLPVIAGIPEAELRRRQATLGLARRPLSQATGSTASPKLKQSQRLKSRYPFVPAARELSDQFNSLDIRAADWAKYSWNSKSNNRNTRLHRFNSNADISPPGKHLPRRFWVRLNHLQALVGRSRSSLFYWEMASSGTCDCSAKNQTAEQKIDHCLLYSPPHGVL